MRARVTALVTVSIVMGWLASVASADTSSEREQAAPGEDDKLYSCKKSNATIEITFKPETEVKDLVTWVMGFTCKNFIYAPHIVAQGRKVTVVAPSKMTTQEAYRLFLASLSTLGLTVVPQGNIVKIVESATAKHLPVPIYKNGAPDNNDQLVRYVMRPQYMQADALAKAIASVKSDPGEITVAGSLLLIVDYASHVRDMMSIAKLVDVPSGSEGVYTIPLQHAEAAKLLPKLTAILGMDAGAATPAPGKGQPAPSNDMQAQGVAPSKILVDERTNTLVVAASVAAYERVKALVERLDIPLDIEGGNSIHVYPLGSAIAEEVAKTLNEAIQKTQAPASSTQPARPGAPPPPTGTGLAEGLDGRAQVVADKPTNKLIVVSSGRDFLAIKEVIKELDQPRRQVYIEALILEVSMGDENTFGASLHGGKSVGSGDDKSLLIGGIQNGTVNSANPKSLIGVTGIVGGILGKTLPGSEALFGTSIPSFGVLIQAMAKRSNTNILSAPSIIALDNEEAKYKVGTNIPYSKGIIPTTTLTENAPVSTNIDRKDLVLELKIKPHISTGDQILLEISHEANDLADGDTTLGPAWSTRGFETRAVVRDQQTFVLGGLMQEKEIVSSQQVPILGDIPLLGHLFKYTSKEKRKTNLVIMLTPYIIKDDLDLEAIRERRMREHVEYTQSLRTFAELKYQPRIDYRRKRGLVEEINRTVMQVEADQQTLELLKRPEPMKTGPVQVEHASPAE